MQERDKIAKSQKQLEKDQCSQRKKLEQQAKAAQMEFEAYSLDYQTVDDQITSIKKEIELLHAECLETQQDAPTCPVATCTMAPMETPYLKHDTTSHVASMRKNQRNAVEFFPYSYPKFDAEES